MAKCRIAWAVFPPSVDGWMAQGRLPWQPESEAPRLAERAAESNRAQCKYGTGTRQWVEWTENDDEPDDGKLIKETENDTDHN